MGVKDFDLARVMGIGGGDGSDSVGGKGLVEFDGLLDGLGFELVKLFGGRPTHFEFFLIGLLTEFDELIGVAVVEVEFC